MSTAKTAAVPHPGTAGLGTAVFGEGNTDGTLERVAAQAAHQGIRLFDTAQVPHSLTMQLASVCSRNGMGVVASSHGY